MNADRLDFLGQIEAVAKPLLAELGDQGQAFVNAASALVNETVPRLVETNPQAAEEIFQHLKARLYQLAALHAAAAQVALRHAAINAITTLARGAFVVLAAL